MFVNKFPDSILVALYFFLAFFFFFFKVFFETFAGSNVAVVLLLVDVVQKLKIVVVAAVDRHYRPNRNFDLALDFQIDPSSDTNFLFKMLKTLLALLFSFFLSELEPSLIKVRSSSVSSNVSSLFVLLFK